MNMFDKDWYPMKTIVPRMTLESKLMATFKPSKFHRLKKLMTEAKKSTSNKLKFVRAQSDKFILISSCDVIHISFLFKIPY